MKKALGLALLCVLVGCSIPTVVPTLQDLMTPEAAVVKLVGDMGFTEGPVWLPKERKLVFSDIPSEKLMEWSLKGGLKLFRESPNPNGNLLDREGRLLTCRHGARDIVRTEEDGKLTVLCDSFEGKRLNSPNDVAVKSDGTLWFTDPPWGLPRQSEGREQEGHWVFRLDPKTKKVTVILKDLCMPNGVAFSPDERHIYIADTGGNWHPDESLRDLPATTAAYQVKADGTLSREPVWKTEGFCDGMCVDVSGNIYTTARAGITVLSPDGEVIGTIKIPESPSNCCFGGDDFQTLFITARTSLYAITLTNPGVMLRKG
jgi:gluconolactonase